jgi:opacity protein-like surface antigen
MNMKNFCTGAAMALLMVVLSVADADAQRFSRRKAYNSVGFHLNAMNYFGDIVPESDFTSLRFKSTRPNIGVSYTRRFTPRISVRAAFAWGRITGDDAKSASQNEEENFPRYVRNLSFRNDIKELSFVGTFDLFENRGNYLKRPDFSPYAFAGVAVFAHNPKAEYRGEFVALQPLGTEGQNLSKDEKADPLGNYDDPYSRVQIAIPFGLGVKYKLDKNWDLGFEIGWRKTFTDYLDDVSGFYANPKDLLDSNPLSLALADRSGESGLANAIDPETGKAYRVGWGQYNDQRGDRTDKDWYIVTGFNLTYILPQKGRSPKFR